MLQLTMTRVRVKGMTCQGCEDVVETAVELIDGVDAASADRYEEVVEANGDVSVDLVAEKVELAGYRALGAAEASPSEGDGATEEDAEEAPEDGETETEHDEEPAVEDMQAEVELEE